MRTEPTGTPLRQRPPRSTALALVAVVIPAALALTACDVAPRVGVSVVTQDSSEAGEAVGSSGTSRAAAAPVPRHPLTGEVLGSGEEVIARPALAVKIDNAGPARPNHSGLAVADLVFEEIVEGNITRFAAIFHTRGSDPVGPIRSGRSQDVDLLTSFGRPLLAWSGGNPGVTQLIAAAPLVDLNWQRGGLGYSRGPGRAPNNLFNDTTTLWSQTPGDHPGPPPQQFEYVLPDERFAGGTARSVSVPMGGIDVAWTWDDASQRYLRSQAGAAHVDALHGRIGATNVVVMAVSYRPSQVDARSPEAQTVGDGPAWVFARGQYVEGRWVRSSAAMPIEFVDAAGATILLEPGTTWIELAAAVRTGDLTNSQVVITG